MKEHVVIVGGGIGGLTSAAFLVKNGFDVTVLEASTEWGGCAGKFSRGPYTFPVGATLGMGFEPGGIHYELLNKLGIPLPENELLSNVMDIHFDSKTLHYFKDKNQYLEELFKHFPHLKTNITAFYQEVWKIGAEVKKLMLKMPVLPPVTWQEWLTLLRTIEITSFTLIPYIREPLNKLLTKHQLSEESEFIALLDSQLIDSMQTTSKECSAIIGAFALSIYHEGAFYVNGGLYELSHLLTDFIKHNGGKLFKKAKVVNIKKQEKQFELTDIRNRAWLADQVVCNLPVPNLINLLEPNLEKHLSSRYHTKKQEIHWGTMTLYLALKEDVISDQTPLFQQILQGEEHSLSEGHHLFLSLSKKGDIKRAPAGFRTLTVSTHTNLSNWRSKQQYDTYKKQLSQVMLEGVKLIFPKLEEGLVYLIEGAPRAWERFTGRHNGMVGGFPQTYQNTLFNSLSHRTGINNLWVCGDSVFPGAGTISVSISGYHVAQSIMKQTKNPVHP